jgi:hypothetical protein
MEDQPVIEVSIVIQHDGLVDLDGDGLSLTMWNHDPARLREAWGSFGRAVWKPHVTS